MDACTKYCADLLGVRAAIDFCDMSVKVIQNFNQKCVYVNMGWKL